MMILNATERNFTNFTTGKAVLRHSDKFRVYVFASARAHHSFHEVIDITVVPKHFMIT